jgi:multidrug efflux pump subunit AcrA (membrane-fusion protein)
LNLGMAKRSTRLKVVNGVLAAVLVGGVILIVTTVGHSSSASATPRSVVPTRGLVSTTVTATGNVQAAQTLSVNFKTGGTLTEVGVAVGQTVTKGQVLAKIDPTDAQNALTEAQASLTAANDKLTQMEQVQTPVEVAQDNAALAQSQTQLAAAQTSLNDTNAEVAADATSLASAVTQARAQLTADQAQLATDEAATPVNSQQVAADSASITKDNASISSAVNAQSSGALKDQASLHQAQNSVASAQAGLTSTEAANAVKAQPPKVGDLAAQQSAVTQAQTQLDTAQVTVNDTVLVAPAAGEVATVSATVGQSVGSGGSSSTSSSSSSSGSGTGGSGSGSSGTGGSSASSGSFITITSLQDMQVVAGFTEVDAAKIQLKQPATVTVSALPGRAITGTVAEIDTLQTVVSNVVTYNVTIDLSTPVAGLKPGMTANVVVTTGSRSDVLRVPNAAVTTRGTTSTARLLGAGNKQTVVPVTIGLRGDTFTEVDSGLTTTDRVVISSGAITGATGTGTGTGGAAARGFGAGGFGGGGFGGAG